MQSLADIAQDIGKRFGIEIPQPSSEEIEMERTVAAMQRIADITNNQWGKLDLYDGYNCPKCKNKGEFYIVRNTKDLRDKDGNRYPFSYPQTTVIPCECMQKRMSYQRNRFSGLPEGYNFEGFKTNTDWQRRIYNTAQKYLESKAYRDGAWFYIGGAVGSGKTHITTALAKELIYEKNVLYFNWTRDGGELKRYAMDGDNANYTNRLYRCTAIDVLFIDDFLRGRQATDADYRLAYEILNERYLQKKATLFTSELMVSEITDEAISSRIFERAKSYICSVARDDKRNMRL